MGRLGLVEDHIEVRQDVRIAELGMSLGDWDRARSQDLRTLNEHILNRNDSQFLMSVKDQTTLLRVSALPAVNTIPRPSPTSPAPPFEACSGLSKAPFSRCDRRCCTMRSRWFKIVEEFMTAQISEALAIRSLWDHCERRRRRRQEMQAKRVIEVKGETSDQQTPPATYHQRQSGRELRTCYDWE